MRSPESNSAEKLSKLDRREFSWPHSNFKDRACPFCHTDTHHKVFIRPDNCQVRVCVNCHTLYVSPAPTESILNAFYSNYHKDHFGFPSVTVQEFIEVELSNFDMQSDPRYVYVSKEVKLNKTSKLKVLDFGCGTGSFLLRAQSLGAEVYGLELDKMAVDFCHQVGLKNVFLGSEDDVEIFGAQFDLIVLNDVIEHILEPAKLVEKLVTNLKVGGKLLIWTPNGEAIMSDDQKIALRVDLEHLQYLSSGSIANLCVNNNLYVNHYQQLGFPSEDNFLVKVDKPIGNNELIKSLVWLSKKFYLFQFVKDLLGRFGFTRQTHSVIGNYHLFCSLVKSK